jgi:hypothetical protein
MKQRTWASVLDEARDEGHEPMHRFLMRLAECPWSRELAFDLSMLRLWIRRPTARSAELMLVYGDDRGGGKPLDPTLDRYELVDLRGGSGQLSITGTLRLVLAQIERWALGAQESEEG